MVRIIRQLHDIYCAIPVDQPFVARGYLFPVVAMTFIETNETL